MSKRCRSWRPVQVTVSGHETHGPGECRICWRPCRQRFGDDDWSDVRCNECEVALARHLNPDIRMALVMEGSLRPATLELLATDVKANIQQRAVTAMEDLGLDPDGPCMDFDHDDGDDWGDWAAANPITVPGTPLPGQDDDDDGEGGDGPGDQADQDEGDGGDGDDGWSGWAEGGHGGPGFESPPVGAGASEGGDSDEPWW